MKFRNGSEAVREALGAQVQQGLNKYIDFQWVEGRLGHVGVGRIP